MYGMVVDKTAPISIVRQLTGQLRIQILSGMLQSGEKLPASRNLAEAIGVSRNTVVQAYEQLIAEGYLHSYTGSGTFVAELKHEEIIMPGKKNPANKEQEIHFHPADRISFDSGTPDCQNFPRIKWANLLKMACIDAPQEIFRYGPVEGEASLRQELSSYLFRAKGIECDSDQIFIIPGTAAGVDLLAKTLRGKGQTVAIENPCVNFIRETFQMNGYTIAPVDVDQHGIRTEHLKALRKIGMVYVVPAHQFPTGGILPVARRLDLIQFVKEQGAYIIEDDYDSEYRYHGDPIQSLRALCPEHVFFIGSFSKIFSPAIRIGYLIVPSEWIPAIQEGMESMNMRAPTLEQRAMAEFIKNRLLDRHIYKMKKIYEKKRMLLISELNHAYGHRIQIIGENAGMHLLVSFEADSIQNEHIHRIKENGVEVEWAEEYSFPQVTRRSRMILGYGGLTPAQITEGVKRIKASIP